MENKLTPNINASALNGKGLFKNYVAENGRMKSTRFSALGQKLFSSEPS